LFSPKAEQLLAKASAGLSRRINILADKALLATYADPATRQGMRNSDGEILPMVQPKHVRVAIKDSAYRVDHTDIRKNLLIGAGMAALLLAGVGVGWWLNRDSGLQPVSLPVAAVEPEAVAAPTPVPVPPAAATVSSVVAENASSTTIEVTASSSPVAAAAKEVAIPPGLTALVAVQARASVPWLASLPGREGYSVQMYAVGISELDKLQDYFEFLELTDMFGDVYMCRISASGGLEAQWLVLHELFEGYSKAESFIRNLPPYLGQHQPYVRNVKGIACTN